MNISKFKAILKEAIDAEMDTLQGAQAMQLIHKRNLFNRLDEFTRAYIQAALWSSTDNRDDSGGAPLENNYTFEDIDFKTLEKIVKQCKDFQKKYKEYYDRGGWSDSEAGHDFWLTRNGHGAGFFDRSENDEEIGKYLTQAAKSYGTYDLYVGDGPNDGIIFGYPS